MNRKLKNSELGRLSIDQHKKVEKIPMVIILNDIRSLNNIGSIFRTADAFLIQEIMLCGITATPPHRDIQKTALGATETVLWTHYHHIEDAINVLRENDFEIVAVEQTEESCLLDDFAVEPNKRYGIIFGNEVKGVSQLAINACDHVIEIPQYGTKHSLNVSIAAGIVIWELTKLLKK